MPAGVGFDPSMYVKVFRLARDGMAQSRIAEALGTDKRTFKKWVKRYPALKDALDQGYGMDSSKNSSEMVYGKETFKDYCLTMLPSHLRDVWADLDAVENTEGEKRFDLVMEGKGRRIKQEIFLHSLIHTNFNKTQAMRRAGVSHADFDRWKRNDPDFLEMVGRIQEMKKDFVEGCLMGLIGSGDSAATIFASKTLNQDRGYGPKLTISHEGTKTVRQITLAKVIHKMTPRVKRQVLDTLRAAKQLGPRIVETTNGDR